VFEGEGALLGAAEQKQRFGEVDRSGVDGAEAFHELAVVIVRIVARHLEQRLGDRQWSTQLVGRVGGEPLLLGDVCFEPGEHRVERVGELAELVVATFQMDAVGERSTRGRACGIGDARQRGQHPTGEDPPSHETDHEEERQHRGCPRSEHLQEP
jgi:hypothetical protein